MKSTGIVRRVDELGRVVIPKELRRTMRLQEGDALEIFTEGNMICLKKYQMMNGLEDMVQIQAKVLRNITGCKVIVTDTEKVISNYKDFQMQEISDELREAMKHRDYPVSKSIKIYENHQQSNYQMTILIVSEGEVIGSITLASDDLLSIQQTSYLEGAANFLGTYSSEK
jgi:AbrB family transcriptional regulator (stage V sporulation protein T)